MRFWFPVAVALALLAAAGCSPEKPSTEAPAKTETAAAPAAGTAPTGAPAGAPAAGGDADAYAPLSPSPDLDKAIADAEKAGDKKKLAAAYARRGAFRTREDDKAGQRVKYRAALSDFRKALEADPKNEDARSGKSEIEQIYTMMGREIPSAEECDEVSRTGKYTPKDAPAPGK